MLALCLMLLATYYAQNYAGIIGRSLVIIPVEMVLLKQFCKSSYIAVATEANRSWGAADL